MPVLYAADTSAHYGDSSVRELHNQFFFYKNRD